MTDACPPAIAPAPPAVIQIVDGGYDWTHRRFRVRFTTTTFCLA